MTRVIEVTVTTDGATKVETHGFTGSSCQDASRFLEQALGQKTNETLTSEFYESAGLTQTNETGRLGGG